MTQKDYILRVAEDVGRALAQILYHKEIRDYQGALSLIDELCNRQAGSIRSTTAYQASPVPASPFSVFSTKMRILEESIDHHEQGRQVYKPTDQRCLD